MSGLVLVVLIALMVAYAYTRMRGKIKLSVTGKNWVAPVVVVGLVLLLLWATNVHH